MQSESESKCEQSLLAVAASLWEAQRLSFSRVRAASPTSLRPASAWQAGRRLQIGPSILTMASSLTHFLRRLSHIGSVRSVGSFVFHVFEVGSEIERFG